MKTTVLYEKKTNHLKPLVPYFRGFNKKCDYFSDAQKFKVYLLNEKPYFIILNVNLNFDYDRTIVHFVRSVFKNSYIVLVVQNLNDETVKKCIKIGADDMFSIDYKKEEIFESLKRGCRLSSVRYFEKMTSFIDIVGRSEAIKKVKHYSQLIKDVDVPVLIHGETGTGKDILAKAIHFSSERKKQPFVHVDCGAISETLFESEIFGHVKGSFTGAYQNNSGKVQIAKNGTLFLNEIGELTLDLQKKLLRLLQEKEFESIGCTQTKKAHCHIIAATNKDLLSMVKEGAFREDLYHRLHVMDIWLPPLRERKEDIPLLIQFFQKKFQKKYPELADRKLSIKQIDFLLNHDFTGNLRELSNIMERLIIAGHESVDDIKLLFANHEKIKDKSHSVNIDEKISLKDYIQNCEKLYIEHLLKEFKGDTKIAAQRAGVSRKTIYQKIINYNILFKDREN